MPTNTHMHNAVTKSHADIVHRLIFAGTRCVCTYTNVHIHMLNTSTHTMHAHMYTQIHMQMHIGIHFHTHRYINAHFHMCVHNHMSRHTFTLIITYLPLPGSVCHSLAGLDFFLPHSLTSLGHQSGIYLQWFPWSIMAPLTDALDEGRREEASSFSLLFTTTGLRLVICKTNDSLLPKSRRL